MTIEEIKERVVNKININYTFKDGHKEVFKAIDVKQWNNETYVVYFDNKDGYFCNLNILRDAEGKYLDEVLGI